MSSWLSNAISEDKYYIFLLFITDKLSTVIYFRTSVQSWEKGFGCGGVIGCYTNNVWNVWWIKSWTNWNQIVSLFFVSKGKSSPLDLYTSEVKIQIHIFSFRATVCVELKHNLKKSYFDSLGCQVSIDLVIWGSKTGLNLTRIFLDIKNIVLTAFHWLYSTTKLGTAYWNTVI